MKYSGVEWIGNVPDSWEVRKVKYCFYISKEPANQKNPTVLSLARSGVKVRDISNNEGQLATSYDNYNVVKPGDLLLNPMDLYSGANCNMSEVEGVISPAYVNLRAREKFNPKFFDYFFKTQYWTMAMFAHGKGVSFDNRWTMNSDAVLNYKIPVPSINIQNQIATFLNVMVNSVDELISIEEKQINSLIQYKKTAICQILSDNSLFGGFKFQKRKFKTLATLCNGKEIPHDGGDIPVYGSGGVFKYTNEIIMTGESLLMGRKGTIDKPLLVNGSFWTVDTMFYTESFKDCVGKYLYYLCSNMIDFGLYKSGSVLPSMTQTDINNIFFDVAPLNVQYKIVELIELKILNIDNLISLKTKKVELLNDYKKSLIFEYVTGKKEAMI